MGKRLIASIGLFASCSKEIADGHIFTWGGGGEGTSIVKKYGGGAGSI